MDCTLWELQAFDRGHDKALKERDTLNYIIGEYMYDAMCAVMSNLSGKKGSAPVTYGDVRKKPVLDDIVQQEEEEVDPQRAYENYIVQRKIDKLNWDLAHMDGSVS